VHAKSDAETIAVRPALDAVGNVQLQCTSSNDEEADRLYHDTSFFPSIGASNPALTAMANAMRVGEHLLERL